MKQSRFLHNFKYLEVWLATLEDHSYGPLAEAIKSSVGEEHEQKIKDILTEQGIPYCDEHVLRDKVAGWV